MTRRDDSPVGLPARLVAIGSIVVFLILALTALERLTTSPPRPHEASAPVLHDAPIAAEFGVFREQPSDAAASPWVVRRTTAHPRTLATSRKLRAYPGAPPRVPHGLTRDEFRDTRCLTCHEHGGFSQRFGAYAPITPHREFEACLQCHATNDAVVEVSLPGTSPDATCRQCHAPKAGPTALPSSDWVSAPWPSLATSRVVPPPIPHELQLRGNCLACHMGPGAIAEIRTPHAERSNCRQCHVPRGIGPDEYVRPVVSNAPASRGVS